MFNPLTEGNGLKKEYVDGERENLKQIIESKIDNKAKYSLDRCIEEMFKGEAYGLYKYGYVEDLENITPENLYARYQELIKTCKIDIFYSGTMDKDIKNTLAAKVILNKLRPWLKGWASSQTEGNKKMTSSNPKYVQYLVTYFLEYSSLLHYVIYTSLPFHLEHSLL